MSNPVRTRLHPKRKVKHKSDSKKTSSKKNKGKSKK